MANWCEDVLAHGVGWPQHYCYLRSCDEAMGQLTLASDLRPFTRDVPTVVCVVRNEERRLPLFLEHYEKLGVKSIHVIDNKSRDQTPSIARSHPKVTLWITNSSYANSGFGQLWVAAIVRRYGIGRWVINVDADELLVYTDMNSRNLHDLQDWLKQRSLQRLFTPLIDLYPKRSSSRDAPISAISTNLAFDRKTDTYSSYSLENSPFGPKLIGGPRGRMMSAIGQKASPWLSKFALACWDKDTAYANVHFPYPFDRNPRICCAALLHLKLLHDFPARVSRALLEREHWNSASEYELYQCWLDLESSGMESLESDDFSVAYEGPESLVSAKIIDPIPW